MICSSKNLYSLDKSIAPILLDPNTLSEDGTVALSTYSVSEDAKYLAYALSTSGSDWVTIKVMCVEDGRVEPETLSWVKFSGISWTHDDKGFFYSRYPAPKEGEDIDAGTETNSNLYHELYYHFVGTDQSKDILCWKDSENPKYLFGASVTDDGKILSRMNVPEDERPAIIEKVFPVLESANTMQPICVVIHRITSKLQYIRDRSDQIIDRVTNESMDTYEVRPIPAAKSFIEDLERLSLDDSEDAKQSCAICMECFEDGVQVIRLPCLHFFHENCTVQWLMTSHSCPLCRYPMPCDE